MWIRTGLSLLFAGLILVGVRGCYQWSVGRQSDALHQAVEARAATIARAGPGAGPEADDEPLAEALFWCQSQASSWSDLDHLSRKVDDGDTGVEGLLSRVSPLVVLLEPMLERPHLRLPDGAPGDPVTPMLARWVASVWVAEAWARGKSDPTAALPRLRAVLHLSMPVSGDTPEQCRSRLECLSKFGMGLDLYAQMPGHDAVRTREHLDPWLAGMQTEQWLLRVASAGVREGPEGLADTVPGLGGWWMRPFREHADCGRLRGRLFAVEVLEHPSTYQEVEAQRVRDELSARSQSRREFDRWVSLGETRYEYLLSLQVMRLALAGRVYHSEHREWPARVDQLAGLVELADLMDPRLGVPPDLRVEAGRLQVGLQGLGTEFVVNPGH